MSDLEDLFGKLCALELPVTLKVGFIEGEIGTLIPDVYWEGKDAVKALANLLEATADELRRLSG